MREEIQHHCVVYKYPGPESEYRYIEYLLNQSISGTGISRQGNYGSGQYYKQRCNKAYVSSESSGFCRLSTQCVVCPGPDIVNYSI